MQRNNILNRKSYQPDQNTWTSTLFSIGLLIFFKYTETLRASCVSMARNTQLSVSLSTTVCGLSSATIQEMRTVGAYRAPTPLYTSADTSTRCLTVCGAELKTKEMFKDKIKIKGKTDWKGQPRRHKENISAKLFWKAFEACSTNKRKDTMRGYFQGLYAVSVYKALFIYQKLYFRRITTWKILENNTSLQLREKPWDTFLFTGISMINDPLSIMY